MKKRLIAVFTAFIICIPLFCFFSYADSDPKVFLLDHANVISSSNEELIIEKAGEVAQKTGFNIVIVAADDIGEPKTDAHTIEYADDKYEELCGIDTDGILFLINCDTKYDYISTSGVCINYFSDARIDKIFDAIWDDMTSENFAQAAYTFLFCVEECYNKGKANNQSIHFGIDLDDFFAFGALGLFFCLFIGVFIFAVSGQKYKLQKPETREYILENSLSFDKHTDTYMGNITTRSYSPRSSSSGHSSGSGSRHSSTHRSHSGGRHGGGGRHR